MADALFRNDDRRREARINARFEVRFNAAADAAKALNAFSVNFSAGGLCLRTKTPRTQGEKLTLALTVEGESFELSGQVAWVRGDAIGVRFENVPSGDRERLEKVARSLESKAPQASR